MAYTFPHCQIVPLPEHQVSFTVGGVERLRWHHGAQYPRPFFYPLISPSGATLTRMGHPGAPNHDHHRSVWFAHEKVGPMEANFWSDNSETRVRQKRWLAYEDGDDAAIMAVEIGWRVGHEEQEILTQELVCAVSPGPAAGETLVELQSTFTPVAASLTFAKTNFGFLAVRVEKHISEHFGGGVLTSSEGDTHEPAIFGKAAKWIDYSGPVAGNAGAVEGVTYFDHPSNGGYPNHWHVREDGWMGCSPGMNSALETTRDSPLRLRYLLYTHQGGASAERAAKAAAPFAKSAPFVASKATVKHRQFVVTRQA